MRAFAREDGMIEVFNREPDEVLTVDEFKARQEKAEMERQAKIEEHIRALRELGINITIDEPEESESEVEETEEEEQAEEESEEEIVEETHKEKSEGGPAEQAETFHEKSVQKDTQETAEAAVKRFQIPHRRI